MIQLGKIRRKVQFHNDTGADISVNNSVTATRIRLHHKTTQQDKNRQGWQGIE